MQPVRLKFCGVQLSRRAYLTAQLLLMAILAVLIVVLYRLALRTPEVGARPWQMFVALIVRNLYWIVPLALALDGIEVVFVLRRFAEKETLERKRPPGLTG